MNTFPNITALPFLSKPSILIVTFKLISGMCTSFSSAIASGFLDVTAFSSKLSPINHRNSMINYLTTLCFQSFFAKCTQVRKKLYPALLSKQHMLFIILSDQQIEMLRREQYNHMVFMEMTCFQGPTI